MALTAAEEALVRELIAQNPELLSLAGNEATIISKLGASKKNLSQLAAALSLNDTDLLFTRQGTSDKSVTPLLLKGYAQDGMATQKGVQAGDYNTSVAAGTADAITGDYAPNILALENGLTLFVRAAAANTTTTPTFSPDGLTAKTIVKGANQAIVAGDIAGAGHWIELQYDATLDKWVLLNPATGVSPVAQQAGEICFFARNTAPTGFLKANGAAISRTTYAALFAAIYKSATVTMTIAAPGVITWNAHGLSANDPVQFTTTGALPTGFVTATQYFVVGASITTNTFRLSATPGGAAITTTGSQSGTHTAHNAPFGIGDGSTTFNVPDLRGEFLRGWYDSSAVDSNRAFGSAQTDQIQGHEHTQLWSAGGGGTTIDGSNRAPFNGPTGGIVTDGTNGTPRIGAETRPRNVAMLACIKY